MANEVVFRSATEQDLERIVEMLADDKLGATREHFVLPLPEVYREAFRAIDADPNNELVVACLGDEVVGVQQITFTPHLTRQGGWRATIEGVRTCSTVRGKGVGTELINWAIQRAQQRGCHLIQLTTDKTREDAIRFYERLGFQVTHEGMKMKLK